MIGLASYVEEPKLYHHVSHQSHLLAFANISLTLAFGNRYLRAARGLFLDQARSSVIQIFYIHSGRPLCPNLR